MNGINYEWYNKDFQRQSFPWWRSLSINQQKELEKKHKTIYGSATPQEVAMIWDKEGKPNPQETIPVK
jgi:hypothetical protein